MIKGDCINCRQPTPEHLLRRGLCPGCYLDTFIPVRIWDRGRYVPEEEGWDYATLSEHPFFMATRRPNLDVELLQHHPTISEVLAPTPGLVPCRTCGHRTLYAFLKDGQCQKCQAKKPTR